MAKIILNRKSEWLNRVRGYKVFIDGEERGAIRSGSADEYTVAAGTHTVECRINWYKSNSYQLTVNENDVKYLMVRSGMKYYGPVYVLLLVFVFAPFIAQKAAYGLPDWFTIARAVLIILLALYFVYYLTIGRKKYLVVEDDNTSVFNK